jgi:hypothetical protein
LFKTWRQSGVAFFPIEASNRYQQWLDGLSRDVAAANGISQLAPELLAAPKATSCESPATRLSEQLGRHASLLAGGWPGLLAPGDALQ